MKMLPFRGPNSRMRQDKEATIIHIILSGLTFRNP